MICRIENINPAANPARENLQPQDPTDLDFELDVAYTPDNFLNSFNFYPIRPQF